MLPTLTDILQTARRRAAALAAHRAQLEAAARQAPPPIPWLAALRGADVAVIAELKRRSPSVGAIAEGIEPAAHARAYVAGGARAISVLTEEPHFGGTLADLDAVRRAVRVPLLRKDFLVVPEQVYEARVHGASAVLLIVRALAREELRELSALAEELGLARLVEVHEPAELDAALAVGPDCVGVNSRDLETLALDLEAALALLAEIPSEYVAVAESGMHGRRDVERAARSGADAVLVGTALAGAPDPGAAVRDLVGVRRRGRGA